MEGISVGPAQGQRSSRALAWLRPAWTSRDPGGWLSKETRRLEYPDSRTAVAARIRDHVIHTPSADDPRNGSSSRLSTMLFGLVQHPDEHVGPAFGGSFTVGGSSSGVELAWVRGAASAVLAAALAARPARITLTDDDG